MYHINDNKQNNQNRPKVFSQHDNYWNISHWLDSDNNDTNMTDHARWILMGTYYQEHKSITVVMEQAPKTINSVEE